MIMFLKDQYIVGECGRVSNLKYRCKYTKSGDLCEIYSFMCSEANKGKRKNCCNTKSISARKLYDIVYPELKKQCEMIVFNKEDIQ